MDQRLYLFIQTKRIYSFIIIIYSFILRYGDAVAPFVYNIKPLKSNFFLHLLKQKSTQKSATSNVQFGLRTRGHASVVKLFETELREFVAQ